MKSLLADNSTKSRSIDIVLKHVSESRPDVGSSKTNISGLDNNS